MTNTTLLYTTGAGGSVPLRCGSADEISSATGSLAPVPAPLAPLLATSRSIRQNFAVIL